MPMTARLLGGSLGFSMIFVMRSPSRSATPKRSGSSTSLSRMQAPLLPRALKASTVSFTLRSMMLSPSTTQMGSLPAKRSASRSAPAGIAPRAPELVAVLEQPQEVAGRVAARDDEDVRDARLAQALDRVVDH